MTVETKPIAKYLPHLTAIVVLLFIEHSIFMTHAASLMGSGDYGSLVGIPLLMAFIIMLLLSIGLYSICANKTYHIKTVTISLVLFIIQLALIFFEYVAIASNL